MILMYVIDIIVVSMPTLEILGVQIRLDCSGKVLLHRRLGGLELNGICTDGVHCGAAEGAFGAFIRRVSKGPCFLIEVVSICFVAWIEMEESECSSCGAS